VKKKSKKIAKKKSKAGSQDQELREHLVAEIVKWRAVIERAKIEKQ